MYILNTWRPFSEGICLTAMNFFILTEMAAYQQTPKNHDEVAQSSRTVIYSYYYYSYGDLRFRFHNLLKKSIIIHNAKIPPLSL